MFSSLLQDCDIRLSVLR